MKIGSNVLRMILAGIVLQLLAPAAARAAEGTAEVVLQQGEDQWVPSLSIQSGLTIQKDTGSGDSVLFEDGSVTPVPLQGQHNDSDVGVNSFVGGSLEIMTPALPI